MFKRILTLCALAFISASAAQASTLLPGGNIAASSTIYGGLELGFFGGPMSFNGSFANFRENVYSDPSNIFCTGCLDFVYNLDNQSNADIFTNLSVSGFGAVLTDVGFLPGSSGGAPTLIHRSANGSIITFDFTLLPHTVIDYLVIQTNARQFETTDVLTVTDASGKSVSVQSLAPVPEPSTLVLLGSGLVGLAGAAKRRLLA